MQHAYLGPSYTTEQCIETCRAHERQPGWERVEDGTARAQVVTSESNPRYYAVIEALERHSSNGVILNTSLNRRGEPMLCSPTDALNMFYGSELQYLMMEDLLVVK